MATTDHDSSGASRGAIEHHYDVGRDFYRLWLDTRMVYSCGYWPGDFDDDIDSAQIAKLAWHAEAVGVAHGSRVLDVGCGWGALLAYLAGDRHAKQAIGLTLSSDQADYARSHLPTNTEVRLEDWRNYQPDEPFDAIISIGAFEHFARPELTTPERREVYRAFFERAAQWLRPEGRLSLQTIGFEDAVPDDGPVATYFHQEVFPESMLPFLSDIVDAAEPYFRVLTMRNDGDHYTRTLQIWQHRLEGAKNEAVGLAGRDTYRHYLRYLRVSRAAFERHDCTLYRIVLERRPAPINRP